MSRRQIVLIVLTAWLTMPAARLACAMSCAEPQQSAPAASHCHDASATPSSEARVQAGHACPDPGSPALAAIIKVRHELSAAAPLTAAAFTNPAGHAHRHAEPRAVDRTNRPPDDLLVPLRL